MRHVSLSFLPKGPQSTGQGSPLHRDASKTRPFALADTSCESLSKAMGLPLATVAKHTVDPTQSGGAGGRSTTSNVMEAEERGPQQ
eukprot:3390021-Pyramimonas_sp.AAC.1